MKVNTEYYIQLLRSIAFIVMTFLLTLIIGLSYLPVAIALHIKTKGNIIHHNNKKIAIYWSYCILAILKHICKINHNVIGQKNLAKFTAAAEKGTATIVISKHQSAWETIFIFFILKCPRFILKKELIYLPIIGIYLKLNQMIFIDRKNKITSIKQIIKSLEQNTNNTKNYSNIIDNIKNTPNNTKNTKQTFRPLVIFPEGKRALVGEKPKFQSGTLAILKNLEEFMILPIALNSGIYWPKNKIYKKPGTIKIEFLTPIYINFKQKSLLDNQNSHKILENHHKAEKQITKTKKIKTLLSQIEQEIQQKTAQLEQIANSEAMETRQQ